MSPGSDGRSGYVGGRRISLSFRALVAGGLIAGLTILGQVFRERELVKFEEYGRQLNLAGRQRMLSQRIAKAGLLAYETRDPDVRLVRAVELRTALDRWVRVHDALLEGDSALGISGVLTEEERERLRRIDRTQRTIARGASDLLVALATAPPGPSPALRSSLDAVLILEEEYLSGMEAVMGVMQTAFESALARYQQFEYLRVGSLLGLLVMLWAFVFFPAGQIIRRGTRDLREKNRQLDAALAEAQTAAKVKSDFLATMSHELRTPLNAVIGLAGLLRQTQLDTRQRQFVDTIGTSGESLLSLINDILDLSKIEAGKLDLEAADFELRDLVETTVRTLALRAEAKGIELLSLVDADVPDLVRGDPGRVRQVLLNLVGNAIKFTEQGHVIVRVHRVRDDAGALRLRFEVEDTGVGIAADVQERLFAPFTQADASTTRKFGGTGLGLSISRRLVELMGGAITLTSAPGVGSTFSFELPFAVAAGAAPSAQVELDRVRGVRVLIVDDVPANRLVLQHLTEGWGMHPVEAGSGREGLAVLTEAAAAGRGFPIAICDWQMPEMDGMEFARRVRADRALGGTRLVLLSSFSRGEDAEEATAAGYDAWLAKPVRHRPLLRALVRALAAEVTPVGAGDGGQAATAVIKRWHGRRVLVADDNPVNVLVARAMLERYAIEVAAAANGREAVEAVARAPFDLVLMDVQMPEMDGHAATRAIRAAEDGTRRTVVVAMSASVLAEDRAASVAAGMDDFLPKPTPVEAMEEMLTRWLGAPDVTPAR
jgi:signal transduction histidine kinase/CheY-like chemotaxis protein